MKKTVIKLSLLPISLLIMLPAFSATPIDLMQQSTSMLSSTTFIGSQVQLQETSRAVDFKKTMHVRIQEMYQGYPVWGADAVVHIPNGEKTGKSFADVARSAKSANSFMNGTIYQNLSQDLNQSSAVVFTKAQSQLALNQAIDNYQHKIGGKPEFKNQQADLIVYIDASNQAHWAYKISFLAQPTKAGAVPAKPTFIMDAVSFRVYSEWNDMKTDTREKLDAVDGGGNGGNKKMGKLYYDGFKKHLSKLAIMRSASKSLCYMQNADVTVKSDANNKVVNFKCTDVDPKHNNIYWDGTADSANGGYSPANDALFGGQVIKHMYQDWYGVPVLTNADGKPMMLNMVVHAQMDNAYWDGSQMVFGDGFDMFYPLTSLGVAAHEISHGFTEQHSNLAYHSQSGGMNEAYSDMAAQAAEVYAYGSGKNSWQIGPEIFKAPDEALRYMDKPSKDCGTKKPGDWCSIDDASQYDSNLDVHYSSGVYNHFFYLLGTTDGWDAKKAFDIMVHANSNYWTSSTNFNSGACGVLQATTDLGYDLAAVKTAFDKVKVNYSSCKTSA